MIQLRAGQNTPLTADVISFGAKASAALDVSALVVAENLRVFDTGDFVFYNQTATAGVRLADDEVRVTLSQVRADAKAVLLVVSADPAPLGGLGPVTAALSENGSVTAEFAITPLAGEIALICLEVYRRGMAWKVRAVGQGYSGGLPVLLTAHGVEVDHPGPDAHVRSAQAATPHGADQGAIAGPQQAEHSAGAPLEMTHGVERLWMIFEDAARSAAALIAARDYATDRLDEELSAAVSDPATRNSPAGAAARQAAHQRYEDLIATAEANHRRDSEHLIRELADADNQLPPALASWDSAAWDRPAAKSDGIRLGELYAEERGPLRIPYCVPVPLTRPLWIDTERSAAVVPVVGALLARLRAADPTRRCRLDVIDLSGAFTGLIAPLLPLLNGPVVTDHSEISPRIKALADQAELAEMAYNSDNFTPPAEHRVLIAADFPHGYQPVDAQRIGALMLRGDLIGLSIMIVGTDESESEDETIAVLSQACRHLPTLSDTPMFDPWTGSAWRLELDLLPPDPHRQARLLRVD
ncbi:TerD family protein [Nocardia goodfellowii]|uniref:Stress response protein SCP2 n=1 Tax=Nocardia goodfellowii TaxID=882446 RepID=A0ABS4Q9J0_9NOCA|nr:TerD family protein [Nocardia goodfellowii]MBP2188354.1 stress response protein SCP2 [Nocardia goodfellowii]